MKKSKNVKFAALMLLVCAVLFCMKPVGVQASTMQTINTKRPFETSTRLKSRDSCTPQRGST